jgi:hypothetical protein
LPAAAPSHERTIDPLFFQLTDNGSAEEVIADARSQSHVQP